MKLSGVEFTGRWLIAAAVFLVIDQLHLLRFTIGFWAIFWTVVFVASLITSVTIRIYTGYFLIAFLLLFI